MATPILTLLNVASRCLARRQPPALDLAGWPIGMEIVGGEARCCTISPHDAARHVHVMGGTGQGKTSLLLLLARSHIHRGEGFALIDPHGDVVQHLLAFVYDQAEEREGRRAVDLSRVHLVEPFHDDSAVSLNPLDPGNFPVHAQVSTLVGIFRRLWGSAWGFRMADVLRNALLTLAWSEGTLAEVPRLLTDTAFRQAKVTRVSDAEVRAYWRDRFEPLTDRARLTWVEPVLNKWGELLADPCVRRLLGRREGCLDIRRVMDEGGWLLVNCARGQLRDASHLVGSLVVAQIQAAALSRADQPEAERVPFTLIVDEFQSFAPDDFETILSESRKYGLRLVVAHQYLGQLNATLQRALFANAATQILFAISPQDAAVLARQFGGEGLSARHLTEQGMGRAILLQRRRPRRSLQILPVLQPQVDPRELAAFAAGLRRRAGNQEFEALSRDSAPRACNSSSPLRQSIADVEATVPAIREADDA